MLFLCFSIHQLIDNWAVDLELFLIMLLWTFMFKILWTWDLYSFKYILRVVLAHTVTLFNWLIIYISSNIWWLHFLHIHASTFYCVSFDCRHFNPCEMGHWFLLVFIILISFSCGKSVKPMVAFIPVDNRKKRRWGLGWWLSEENTCLMSINTWVWTVRVM